jgi:hypothetical protein
MTSRYEELFNAMKAGEQSAKVTTPKTEPVKEKAPSKESQQAAADAATRKKEEAAPTTKSEMGSLFKKGGSVGSASKRADGIAVKGKTRGRMV